MFYIVKRWDTGEVVTTGTIEHCIGYTIAHNHSNKPRQWQSKNMRYFLRTSGDTTSSPYIIQKQGQYETLPI